MRSSTPGFRGRYFVLKGHLSPLDGLGPEAIGIPELLARIAAGSFTEVILATNPTVEGEATAHYIAQLLAGKGLIASRIAHGMPLGGELELVDGGTLAHSICRASTYPVVGSWLAGGLIALAHGVILFL